MPNYRKKLIEVNIPLQAINQEAAKDASLTHGHPSTLHRYWSRKPLATCRALIFASMVDDPIDCPEEFPTEQPKALKTGKNALASSIVLVCRPRPEDAPISSRTEFLQALKKEMPPALERLTRIANIRPVDLAQAAIGPGMEIYSRYSKVARLNGELVPIREALMYINNEITAYHEKVTGELDLESQFCLTWLKQHGYMEGHFGDAQVLATAQDVDIAALHDKVLLAARGRVRLLRAEEYAERENRAGMTAWEGCLRMMWHLSVVAHSGGILGCAAVARAMRDYDAAKRLARVLYAYYEGRGDSESASNYNHLVTEWPYISEAMGLPGQTESLF